MSDRLWKCAPPGLLAGAKITVSAALVPISTLGISGLEPDSGVLSPGRSSLVISAAAVYWLCAVIGSTAAWKLTQYSVKPKWVFIGVRATVAGLIVCASYALYRVASLPILEEEMIDSLSLIHI